MSEKNKKPLEPAELTDDELEQAAGGGNERTICACCHRELGTNVSCPTCYQIIKRSWEIIKPLSN